MNKWHDKWHDIDKWAVEELCSCTCCVYQPYIVKDQMKKLGEGTQGVSSNMEGNWGSNLAIVSIKYNVLLVYTRAARPTSSSPKRMKDFLNELARYCHRRVKLLQPRIVPSRNGRPYPGRPCFGRTATVGCLESSPHTIDSPMGFLESC